MRTSRLKTPLVSPIGYELTPDQKLEVSYQRSKHALRAAVAAIILALLGWGLAMGLGLGYGINNGNSIQNNYNLLHNEIALLRANAFEAIMNVSGGSTPAYTRSNILNGTFNWRDDYGLVEPGLYSVDLVTVGPLNFQLLSLGPPANPLIINPFSAGIFTFRLTDFNPFISQLVQAPQTGTGVISIPLTSSNAAKISVNADGGCFANYFGLFPPAPAPISPFCFERGKGGDQASTSRNSLVLLSTNPASGITYYLSGDIVYSPSTHLNGQAFSLSSPWELVLDAF